MAATIITAIEKNGPIITCATDDPKNRTYVVDFKNGEVRGLTGKPLSSTRSFIGKIPYELSRTNPLYAAIQVLAHRSCVSLAFYSVVESLLSYPDLVFGYIDISMIYYIIDCYQGKLPKGYTAWCREHNKTFSISSLEEFEQDKKFAQWPQELRDTVKRFNEGTDFDIAKTTHYDKELCASLIRIATNSLKRFQISDLISNLRGIISLITQRPDLRLYLDETKSSQIAYQILETLFYKERNDQILANEARIAELNGMVIDHLMVKVPSTMSDFTDEGEQQHNCVGYYYHDSIATGRNLIYFLRRSDNPDVSFITCRFDVYKMKTMEYRQAYNVPVIRGPVINQVDNMISAILKR